MPIPQPPPQIKSFYCPRSRRVAVDVHPKPFRQLAKRNHIHDGVEIKNQTQAKSFQWSRSHLHADVELKSSDSTSPEYTGASNKLRSYCKLSELSAPDGVAEFDTMGVKEQGHEDGEEGAVKHSLVHIEALREVVEPYHSKLVKSSDLTEVSVCEARSCRFKLGQVADYSDVAVNAQPNSLIQIARLKVNDGAFIKRSDNDWTYAILKARVMGDDPHFLFTLNEKGSTKSIPMSHWAKFVRLPNSVCATRVRNEKKIIHSSTADLYSPPLVKETHMKSFFSALRTIQVHPIDVKISRVVRAK